MSSVDWDEVKRLAADFQRAQLGSTSQRLTERNCIEVITRLVEEKLLDVIFTTDGKEYITPQHLVREIKDELHVNSGRVNLVDVAKTLNVNLSHIESKAAEIERIGSSCTVILGQLISRAYINRVAEEINEYLIQHGQVTVGELARQYDLPGDFLQSVVEKKLGKVIQAKQDKQDPRVFFTEAFVTRNKSIVRGALAAATRPITVTAILNQCNISERTFYSVIDSLLEAKQIYGTVSGRQGATSTYVPYIYSKAQNEWADNFYRQNGYLEYSALNRLGLADPQTFIRKHFASDNLMLLQSCAVGKQLLDQIEGSVEEAISSGSWIDVMPLLPTVFEIEDGEKILNEVLKSIKKNMPIHIFCNTVLVTEQFLESLVKPFHDGIIQKKVEEAVSSGQYQQYVAESKLNKTVIHSNIVEEDSKIYKKEERRRKAAGGKGGGGVQGRETKTKSMKKKQQYRAQQKTEVSDSDDEIHSAGSTKKFELITVQEIEDIVKENPALKNQDDLDETLISSIANHFHPILNKTALANAESLCANMILNTSGSRRKTHSELENKINVAINDVRLYEKAIKQFSNKDTQTLLEKYLLKTVSSEIVNTLFVFLQQEGGSHEDASHDLTPEMRVKMLNEFSKETKEPLMRLHKAVIGNSVDDFLAALEPACATADIMIRKADKKKDRPQVHSHRQALLQQLSDSDDPALVLHLTALLLFQSVTQNILHASGRFVSSILQFLAPHLSPEVNESLHKYHDLVLRLLTVGENEDERAEIVNALKEDMEKIKDIATNFKKNSTNDKIAS